MVGYIPAPLLTESISSLGFDTIQSQACSILTNLYSSTIKDPQYCAHCYDMLTNISENHENNPLVSNRELTVANDKFGGLGVRGKGYLAIPQ